MKRKIFGLILATSILTMIWTHFRFVQDDSFRDFGIYRMSSEYILKGEWSNLYNFQKDGSAVFRYIPPALVFFSPWAAMDLHLSRHLWHLLQCLVFIFAFGVLYQIAKQLSHHRKKAFIAWALTFFMSLRFVIDTLYNGQIEAFLLLGYAGALYFLVGRLKLSESTATWAGAASLSLPTSLKIAPGFLTFLYLAKKPSLGRQVLAPGLILLGFFELVFIAFLAWKGAPIQETHSLLWKNWFGILIHDAEYFDSSIFKNQSLNGALLRLQVNHAAILHKAALVLGCASVAWVWWTRRPESQLGLALFFTLGVLCHLLFMPETMKYSMVQVAPVFLVYLMNRLDRADKFILGFSVIVLSLGGSSTVGEFVFRWLLDHSFGTLALILLFVGLFKKALEHSKPKRFFEEYETPGLARTGKGR